MNELRKIIESMTERMMRVRVYCCGLIDQNRYIGGDPVGHACSNRSEETVWRQGVNFRLCRSCAELWRQDSPRLTVYLHRGQLGADE